MRNTLSGGAYALNTPSTRLRRDSLYAYGNRPAGTPQFRGGRPIGCTGECGIVTHRIEALGVGLIVALLCLLGCTAPAAANGWFPSWSPTGHHLVSGSGDLTLDDRPLGIAGWTPVFETEDTFVYTDAESGLSRYTISTGRVAKVRSYGFNDLAAGGGVWAGWRPSVIETSAGPSFSGAGNPTVNPDGKLAYVTPRDALVRTLVMGDVQTACQCGELNWSRQAAVWTQYTAPVGTWYVVPGGTPQKVVTPFPAEEYRPIAIDTPEGAWVGNHTQTGLIVRPASATVSRGYRFDNGGQAYYPAWVYRADTNSIIAAYSDQRGVLQTHAFPLYAARIDLAAAPPPIDAPPPPPPAATCSGFEIKILAYQTTGQVGHSVPFTISVTLPADGPLTNLYADLRGDGRDGQRINGTGLQFVTGLAVVPEVSGTYDLHAEADTAHCHAETGAQRWVTVSR